MSDSDHQLDPALLPPLAGPATQHLLIEPMREAGHVHHTLTVRTVLGYVLEAHQWCGCSQGRPDL